MNTVYVASAGIISSAALTAEELAESFGGEQAHYELPLAFTTKVPSSKLRRCSRYIKMACAVADQALSASAATGRFPPERTGAVFSTGFGAVESNITFSDSVVKGDPALCPYFRLRSPTAVSDRYAWSTACAVRVLCSWAVILRNIRRCS